MYRYYIRKIGFLIIFLVFGLFFLLNPFNSIAEAASRYWVGGGSSANWDATGNTNWSATSGGANNASVPGAADDVFFDGVGAGASNSTLSASITINSLDMTGYANTLTHNASVTLTMDSSGTFLFSSGMTYTLGSGTTSALNFTNTSGTATITSNGKTVGNITFNGAGGTRSLADGLTSTGVLTLTAGTFTANSQTVSISTFSSSNSNTRTLTMGSGTWTLTGTGTVWDFTTTTGLTFDTTGNAILALTSSSSSDRTIEAGNKTFRIVQVSAGSGTFLINNPNNVSNLTFTGFSGTWGGGDTAITILTLTLSSTMTVQAGSGLITFGITGIVRYITSNGVMIDRPITISNNSTGTFTLADDLNMNGQTLTFSDGIFDVNNKNITAGTFNSDSSNSRTLTMGSGTWTLNGTGTVFTTATTTGLTLNAGTSTVSLTNSSATSRTVTSGSAPIYNLSVTAGTGTVTLTNVVANNLDFTGFSGTWASSNITVNGNLAISSGMTVTSGSTTITLAATSGTKTITSNGNTIDRIITMDGVGGTWQLADALNISASALTLTNGTFDSNSKNITAGSFSSSNSNTRTATLTNSSLTLNSTGTVWSFGTVTGLTFNSSGSTINVSDTSGTAKTFAGGGLTYGTVTFSGDNITISGSNTFNTLNVNNAGQATGLKFTSGTTQTVTTFATNGSSGSLAIILSSSSGTAFTLSKSTGVVIENYMSIKDSSAAGGAGWYAGSDSTNVSGNSGWIFSTYIPSLSSLGGHVSGSYINDTTPTLSFTLSHVNSSAEVKYQIQIDDSSDFSSAIVDYTSALAAQGATSFTVGQTAGSGSYTTGSSGQTLTDGNYYWRVKGIDDASQEASYSTANSGSIAFIVETVVPLSFNLDGPADSAYVNNERPTFRWKATTDATSGMSKYKLEASNDASGVYFNVDGIPTSGTSDVTASRYVIHFDGFSDSDTTNNYISVYTKSSSDWSSSSNDGKLKEGKSTWKVIAFDNAGNTTNSSRTIYADYTIPVLASVALSSSDSVGSKDGYAITTTLTPSITGTITDSVMPDKIIISFYKQNFFLGVETSQTLELSTIHSLNNTSSKISMDFNFAPSQNIDYEKYEVTVTGIDKAGNKSLTQTLSIQILTDAQAKTILQKEGQKRTSAISLPDLEKKALLRREKEASEFKKTLTNINSNLAFAGNSISFLASKLGAGTHNFAVLWQSGARNASTAINAAQQATVNSVISMVQNVSEINYNIQQSVGLVFATAGKTAALGVDTVLEKTTAAVVNTYKSTIALIVPQEFNDSIERGAGAIAFAFNSTFEFIDSSNKSALSSLSESQQNAAKQISDAQAKTVNQIIKMTDSVQNIVLGTANVFKQTQDTLADSQLRLKDKIANANKDASYKLSLTGRGAELVLESFKRPIDSSAAFLDKVKVGVLTFQSVVFDPNPTRISGVTIEEIGSDFAVVSWKTNHYARGKVNYGKDLTYGEEVHLDKREKLHTARLTGLKPGERYFFEVMSQNKNYTYDAYYSFETLTR